MKNFKNKGITLVSLVITVIVLLILASIATYSGINVIKSSKFTAFTTELKIMQTQVNELYQRYKDGDNIVLDFGEDLDNVSEQANKAFNASGITEQSEYRYFNQNTIKNFLKIEGVEGEFFVNIKTRSVVSYEGFKYERETYYTLDQLPNGLYNVEYNDKNINVDKPTFDTSVEKISEGKWRVTVSNIQYNGYIDKWQVKYKLEGKDHWNTTEDLSFIATESGEYVLQLVNGNIKSDEKIITVNISIKYETEGMLIYCDADESNVKNTTDDTIKIWEDLSGNNNDITLNNVKINADKSLSAIDTTTYAEKKINISGNHTIEVIAKYDTTDIGHLYTLQQDEEHYFYLWNYSDSGATISYRYRAAQQWNVFDNITDETSIQGNMYSISIAFNEKQKVAKIYINGVYKKSVTLSYYTSMENIKILLLNSLLGNRPLTGGAMYSIRVYEQELTEEQVGNNFIIDKVRYGIK